MKLKSILLGFFWALSLDFLVRVVVNLLSVNEIVLSHHFFVAFGVLFPALVVSTPTAFFAFEWKLDSRFVLLGFFVVSAVERLFLRKYISVESESTSIAFSVVGDVAVCVATYVIARVTLQRLRGRG